MIKMILATGMNGELGNKGELLFNCPEDLSLFKKKTMGCAVIMGRKTFESLPFKDGLPGRQNYVMSSKSRANTDNVTWCKGINSKEIMLLIASGVDIWIIGGAEIYALFEDMCDEFHWTIFDEPVDEYDTEYIPNCGGCNKVRSDQLIGDSAKVYILTR